MKKVCIAVLIALIAPFAGTVRAAAPEAPSPRYYPIDDVRVGQRGYGMTVFQGNKLERFEVEILGVLDGIPSPKTPVPTRLRTPSASFITRAISLPVCIESK